MTQISNDFDQSICLAPESILNLVNERLLKPTQQHRISKLESYFLGYKEFLGKPPSPAPSDDGELFSYDRQDSPKLNGPSPKSPTLRASSQSPPKSDSIVTPNKVEKPSSVKGTQRITEKSRIRGKRSRRAVTHAVQTGRLAKAYTRNPHHMETRSRARARRLSEWKKMQITKDND